MTSRGKKAHERREQANSKRYEGFFHPRGEHEPLPPNRETMIALSNEELPVNLGNGKVERRRAGDLIIEKTIERALRGDFAECRLLYEKLDVEEDKAIYDVSARVPDAVKDRTRSSLSAIVAHYCQIRDRLAILGLIEIDPSGRYRIPQSVAAMVARRPQV